MNFPMDDLSLTTVCSFLRPKDLVSMAAVNRACRRCSDGQWKGLFLIALGDENMFEKQASSKVSLTNIKKLLVMVDKKPCFVCKKNLLDNTENQENEVARSEKKPLFYACSCRIAVHLPQCAREAGLRRCNSCKIIKCNNCAEWRGCDGCGMGYDDENPEICGSCFNDHPELPPDDNGYCPGCRMAHWEMEEMGGMDY